MTSKPLVFVPFRKYKFLYVMRDVSSLPWKSTFLSECNGFVKVHHFLPTYDYVQQFQNTVSGSWNLQMLYIWCWWKPCTSYCWFSHDVTKIQTTKLSILLRFYFHGVLEQLKNNFQTSLRFKRVLGFVTEYAWNFKLLRDAAFTWRPKELSFRIKKWLFSRNFAI